MDIQAYIESGILELYVSGKLPDQEAREVYALSQQYPEIQQEVETIEAYLITYFSSLSPKVPDEEMLSSSLAAIEELNSGATSEKPLEKADQADFADTPRFNDPSITENTENLTSIHSPTFPNGNDSSSIKEIESILDQPEETKELSESIHHSTETTDRETSDIEQLEPPDSESMDEQTDINHQSKQDIPENSKHSTYSDKDTPVHSFDPARPPIPSAPGKDTLAKISIPDLKRVEQEIIANKERTSFRFLFYIAAAAVTLLLVSIGLNIYLFNNNGKLKKELALMEDTSTNELLSAQARLAEASKLLSYVQNPSTAKVKLNKINTDIDAEAIVYWNSQSQEVFVEVVNLPSIDADQQYQLWAIKGEPLGPVSAGVFELSDSLQRQSIPVDGPVSAFAISLEPRGGSEIPTADQIFALGEVNL